MAVSGIELGQVCSGVTGVVARKVHKRKSFKNLCGEGAAFDVDVWDTEGYHRDKDK